MKHDYSPKKTRVYLIVGLIPATLGLVVLIALEHRGIDMIAPVIQPQMKTMHPTGLGCMDNLVVVTLGRDWFYKLDTNGRVIACGEARD